MIAAKTVVSDKLEDKRKMLYVGQTYDVKAHVATHDIACK